MNEKRIRTALEDPQASADQLSRALSTINLSAIQRATRAIERRHERLARKQPGSTEERTAACEWMNAAGYYGRACRYDSMLRHRLEQAEAGEASVAESCPDRDGRPHGHTIRIP